MAASQNFSGNMAQRILGDSVEDNETVVLFQIDIPDEIASEFAEVPGGVGRAALEALALEGLRSGRLVERQARVILDIPTRNEMDGFLKLHGVFLSDTFESVVRDCETAAQFIRR